MKNIKKIMKILLLIFLFLIIMLSIVSLIVLTLNIIKGILLKFTIFLSFNKIWEFIIYDLDFLSDLKKIKEDIISNFNIGGILQLEKFY